MPPRQGPPRLVAGPEESFPGSDYSDEERVFLLAMERYKRERRRPFPTWREVLHVAHSLGYRKVAEAALPPLSRLCGRGAGGEGQEAQPTGEEPSPPSPLPALRERGD